MSFIKVFLVSMVMSVTAAGAQTLKCEGLKSSHVVFLKFSDAETLLYSSGGDKGVLKRERRSGKYQGWSYFDLFIDVSFQADRYGRITGAEIGSKDMDPRRDRFSEAYGCREL